MVRFTIDFSEGRLYTMEQFEQAVQQPINNFQQNENQQPKTVQYLVVSR